VSLNYLVNGGQSKGERGGTAFPTGALKMRDWKMRDWNYQHQIAGVENARLEISAPCYRGWKMRDWNYQEQETYGTPRVA